MNDPGYKRKPSGFIKPKLTAPQVLRIRERVANGERQMDVADDVGISRSNVSQIVLGLTWGHI